ncbi:MAG: hypothetical protein MUE44_14730 [Oscillatoriaceae cyanobacterium Prado104]|jgi:hypothetical protein|nr:hypothetical protein [Oscillatoriaceae cyanobacterium Prado104]
MIAAFQLKSSTFACSKILHKSPILHPLARFVTEETVALLFNISTDQIYRIECCRYMVYVHAKGVSRFVSYADFPPILDAELPKTQDFGRWYKRWQAKTAPDFWTLFYSYQFKKARSTDRQLAWGKLVAVVKSLLSATALQKLRDAYAYEKYCRNNF